MLLHKILPFFISPLFLLVFIAVVALWLRRRGWSTVALAILWLISIPYFADFLWRTTEQHAQRLTVDAAPQTQTVVVLGGMTRVVKGEQGFVTEWNENADRFFAAIDLYKAGKAPRLFFMGSRLPWSRSNQNEGNWLREQAINIGVPAERIWVSPEVQNTDEEAQAVAKEIPGGEILLVTSAFHMPRAKMIFEKRGLKVLVFPVDFRVAENDLTLLDFLPNPAALAATTNALRELFGRFYYWVRS